MKVLLVVTEHADTRQALGRSCAAQFPDVQTVVAESGPAGLEHARRTPPGVVVLDLAIPDAFAFVERLRHLSSPFVVPIVALTAEVETAALLRAEAAGFAAFLRPPVDIEALDLILRPLLESIPAGER